MVNLSKHSEVACLSKASIFKNLPLSLKKKLVTITSHQDFFPKGSLIRQPLDGQDGMIVIDSGHLAAMTPSCQMDIQTIRGLKNVVFGGEGLFNTVITGPGRVWLQTMPISNVAGALRPYFPTSN